MPSDPTRPMIMVGPGTGLAPFRGFLQERKVQAAAGVKLGPAMLFFGCRRPDHDFLYREELDALSAEGIMELHVAYSRGDKEKTYVQDLLRTHRSRVWELIQTDAVVYVCGDGSRMEPDVKRALVRIHSEENDFDSAASDIWIDQMGKDGRYVLDVWSGN